MKKFVLILAIFGFVAFSGLRVQNIKASPTQMEMLKFDKDPKKANDKKVGGTKDIKGTEAKAANKDAKVNTSASADKSATSKSCSDKDKAGCCSSSPDKK